MLKIGKLSLQVLIPAIVKYTQYTMKINYIAIIYQEWNILRYPQNKME